MHCKDIWKKYIPRQKQAIYKMLPIRDLHITYVRNTGETIVEYELDMTEEERRERINEYARLCSHDGQEIRHS